MDGRTDGRRCSWHFIDGHSLLEAQFDDDVFGVFSPGCLREAGKIEGTYGVLFDLFFRFRA